MSPSKCAVHLVFTGLLISSSTAEFISDLIAPEADESAALALKSTHFWQNILDAAHGLDMDERFEMYARADEVITSLSTENNFVKNALQQALQSLKRADHHVLLRLADSSENAAMQLARPQSSDGVFSFLTGGQNFLQHAIRRFVGLGQDGRYLDRVSEQLGQRQSDVLPLLRDMGQALGNVLSDTRLASKLCFDVLKYDVYSDKVPKTPLAAKIVADLMIDKSLATRRRFMKLTDHTISGITDDVNTMNDAPGTTIVQSVTGTRTPFGSLIAPPQAVFMPQGNIVSTQNAWFQTGSIIDL